MLTHRLKIKLLIFTTLLIYQLDSIAQVKETKFNGFGHVEFSLDNINNKTNSYYSLGEHSFFVTSKLNNKISFLGEYVVRYNSNSATGFLPSIERSFVKFNYYRNHSIIAGKIHTPLNYWNDVYHHGRLFFPTIHRPNSFNYFIPLHTLGVQFQGQNIGKLNFGYDIIIGNGINSTDIYQGHVDPPLGISLHIKPIDGMRIGLSHYYDYLPNNISGSHTGHTKAPNHSNVEYTGAIGVGLSSFSFAYFAKNIEILNEFNINTTRTDTLGKATNYSNFTYFGYPFADKNTIYALHDIMNVEKNDLYTNQIFIEKIGIGYKYEFSYLLNIKAQLEYERRILSHNLGNSKRVSLEIQLAYGF